MYNTPIKEKLIKTKQWMKQQKHLQMKNKKQNNVKVWHMRDFRTEQTMRVKFKFLSITTPLNYNVNYHVFILFRWGDFARHLVSAAYP